MLIDWLRRESRYPKVYWQEGARALAACGSGGTGRKFIAQMGFGRAEGVWQGLPEQVSFVPAEIREGAAVAAIEKRRVPYERVDWPDFATWEEQVKAVMLEKVVLARQTTLRFSEKVDPFAALASLPRSERTTLFLLQTEPGSAFVGATPERLYRRRGREVETEAVAGTRPRGSGEELRGCAKERREFGYVKRFLEERMAPLCETWRWEGDDRVIATPTVEHLYNRFMGVLREGVSDEELLAQLHPTPAMGGFPQQEAMAYLRRHEMIHRGWYASPIGWVGSDVAVAIRSALIRGKEMHLFAGAGIVEGSQPAQEWEELNHKMEPFL